MWEATSAVPDNVTLTLYHATQESDPLHTVSDEPDEVVREPFRRDRSTKRYHYHRFGTTHHQRLLNRDNACRFFITVGRCLTFGPNEGVND